MSFPEHNYLDVIIIYFNSIRFNKNRHSTSSALLSPMLNLRTFVRTPASFHTLAAKSEMETGFRGIDIRQVDQYHLQTIIHHHDFNNLFHSTSLA